MFGITARRERRELQKLAAFLSFVTGRFFHTLDNARCHLGQHASHRAIDLAPLDRPGVSIYLCNKIWWLQASQTGSALHVGPTTLGAQKIATVLTAMLDGESVQVPGEQSGPTDEPISWSEALAETFQENFPNLLHPRVNEEVVVFPLFEVGDEVTVGDAWVFTGNEWVASFYEKEAGESRFTSRQENEVHGTLEERDRHIATLTVIQRQLNWAQEHLYPKGAASTAEDCLEGDWVGFLTRSPYVLRLISALARFILDGPVNYETTTRARLILKLGIEGLPDWQREKWGL
jgi:hypothetical protein